MASVFSLKAVGLVTQPNQLEVPDGSLTVAKNVVINRDNVVEPRRGFAIYGNTFGTISDRAKQLINYKNRILRHFASTLQFDDGSGLFNSFSGSYTETESGLRLKSIESNGNLYFTTSEGIMKISARDASDFTTSSGYITKSGAVKAVDSNASLVYTYGDQSSFFLQDSAIAYRVVWGYRDLNNNLFLGVPSQRMEVYNPMLSLMLQDYMKILSALDSIGFAGSLIDDQDYVNTLKLTTSASASDLRTNLISLVTKIDNNILFADNDGAPTGAPLEINTASIAGTVCTINFASGDPTQYLEPGSLIFLSGFSPASGTLNGAQTVATVTATDITFNTTASGVVTVDPAATIVSNEYRNISQPPVPEIPTPHGDLVDIQDYINLIIEALNQEPNSIIPTAALNDYIAPLDITTNSTVSINITIPNDINSSYFFQIYRSSVFTADDTAVLATDVFPNDELQLVYEAYPTSAEITAGTINVIDVVPDAFRGANLYTNASTGEGIIQANDIPPFAKDINVFKNSIFYANTRTRHRLNSSLIGVQGLIDLYNSGTIPTLTVATSSGYNTYTFVVGESETFTLQCGNGASLASSGTADYIDINSGNNTSKYRFYYLAGTAVAPASGGRTLIPIEFDVGDTATKIAERTRDAINTLNNDFTASSVTDTVSVSCITVGYTDDPVDGGTGFVITVTNQGLGEDASSNQVLISSDVSPARAVDQTANSLIRVINKNANETIYGFYVSGAQEVPGRMLFEGRGLNDEQFYLVTNVESAGASFSPTLAPTLQINSITVGSPTTMLVTTTSNHNLQNLDFVNISGSDSTPSIDGLQQITYVSPTTFRVNVTTTIAGTKGGIISLTDSEASSNEEAKNRIYYSKFQQPESVPVLNYFDVGAKDKAILRIYPLRDSLFVFKEDGLYRISGESIPFNLGLFDSSCIAVAPDSVSSVDNVIYCWTRQGISSITESGVRNVSRPLDVDLLPLSSTNYPNFSTATWGIGYESDKSYTVYTVNKTSDTAASIGYKFNTLTNSWTSVSKDYTCGVIETNTDVMYVGAGDTNSIEKERKSFTREDYADREYIFDLQDGKYLNKVISMDSVLNIEPFDVFVQYQTLTIYDFNSLLKKLDIDPGVPSDDYFSTLEALPGANLREAILDLADKLDSDSLGFTNYESTIGDKSGSITAISAGSPVTITSANHGLLTGRKVLLSATNSSPTINGIYEVTVVDNNNFTINASVINPGTTGTFTTQDLDFQDLKTCYNELIEKLNIDSVVGFSGYQPISITTRQEILITNVDRVAKRITLASELDYVVGKFTVFKSIDCEIQYSPNTFGGDPVSLKHMREAQFMFESLAFTRGIMSFATDLLPKFEQVIFNADGNGRFGFTDFGLGFFGGASNSAPIRTYIPRNCQRCRYMVIKFNHRVAREKWSLFGITITGETELSTRSYR